MEQIQQECRLCRKSVPLSDSHFMPRALYRFVRSGAKLSPNAVVVSKTNSWLSSRQVSDYVFCAECEALLNEGGEQWVLANCWRGGASFKLRDSLRRSEPSLGKSGMLVFEASQIPSIQVTKLVYFASSIIWRASIHIWKYEGHQLKTLDLGVGYQEEFRLYLLVLLR